MRMLRTAEDFIGGYGPTWRTGVLDEHLSAFVAAGGAVRAAASGSGLRWAVLPDGEALPVLCSEIIAIITEDGPDSGRCGADATTDGMCPGHAEQMAGWRAMSEAERFAWEKAHA